MAYTEVTIHKRLAMAANRIESGSVWRARLSPGSISISVISMISSRCRLQRMRITTPNSVTAVTSVTASRRFGQRPASAISTAPISGTRMAISSAVEALNREVIASLMARPPSALPPRARPVRP